MKMTNMRNYKPKRHKLGWYSTSQTMAILELSKSRIHELAEQKILKTQQPGGRKTKVYYSPASVLAYKREQARRFAIADGNNNSETATPLQED